MIAPGGRFGRGLPVRSRAARARILKVLRPVLGLLMVSFAVLGQGRIDPSLPTAPISFTRKFLMTPGVDTVKDPHAIVPALTTRQKYSIFWHRTADISLPLESAFLAGYSQVMKNAPHYGTDGRAYADRFGSYAGNMAASNFFTEAFAPTLFKQDPRYFRKGSGSMKSRLLYALKQEVITHNDSGEMSFNYSQFVGVGMATALGDSWFPRNRLTLGGTMERYALKLGFNTLRNVAHEFSQYHENKVVVAAQTPAP